MISKETIDNVVRNAVIGFDNVKECNTRIDVNSENQLRITLFLTVNESIYLKKRVVNLYLNMVDKQGESNIYCYSRFFRKRKEVYRA